MSKAYDLTPIDQLCRLIKMEGILTEQEIESWMTIYSRTIVKCNSYTSQMSNGVPQGSIIAPLLFSIFTETLIKKLRKQGLWLRLYADDIVVMVETGK